MLGVAWVALARTQPQAACGLPMGIPIACTTTPDCVAYNAICDTVNRVCVCPQVADGGGATDAATSVDSGGGGGGGAGGSGGGSGAIGHGGGQTGPQRTGGCSAVGF